MIPFAEGRALFEAAAEPKAWYSIPRAGHNDTYLVGGEGYFRRLATFVADLGGEKVQGYKRRQDTLGPNRGVRECSAGA